MKKYLAIFLALLVSSTALGQYEIRTIPGVNTVIYQSTVGQFATVNKAFDRAFESDTTGTVTFASPGTYIWGSTASTVNRSRKKLLIPPTVTLVAGSASVGIATFNGDDITVEGGGLIRVDSWVNDQEVMVFTGRGIVVQDLTFKVNATAGRLTNATTSNPMSLIHFNDAYEKRVDGITFLPGLGFICIESTNGNALYIDRCRFTNDTDGGLGGTDVLNVTPRCLYRGIDIVGDEWGRISGCRFWAQGDGAGATGTASEVDALIRMVRPSTPTNAEGGHFLVSGNTTEACSAPKAIQLWGMYSTTLTGNIFGWNLSPNATGEAQIVVTGIDGTASGSASNGIYIMANDFHNNATTSTAASFIYADAVDNLNINGNNFGVIAASVEAVIRLLSANVEEVSVLANVFQAQASTGVDIVRLLAGTYSGTLVVGGNRLIDITGDVVDSSAATVSGTIFATGLQDISDGGVPDGSTTTANLTTNIDG